MAMVRWNVVTGGVALAALLVGCTGKRAARPGPGRTPGEWRVEKLSLIENLDLPECVAPDPARGVVYISNMVTATLAYWTDDGNGFISLAATDGQMKKLRWLESTSKAPINDPKGMCILKGRLYFNDNARLMRVPLDGSAPAEEIPIPGAEKLNDLATDGAAVWVSDTGAGKVFRLEESGSHREVPSPAGVNGLACHKGRLFAVSWTLHEAYELDPAGVKAPVPFGVASHFECLDTIEVLEDGTFLVSDLKGNKVCTIAPDRKTVRTLIELEAPADVGLDRGRGLLYVPQVSKNCVAVFRLSRR